MLQRVIYSSSVTRKVIHATVSFEINPIEKINDFCLVYFLYYLRNKSLKVKYGVNIFIVCITFRLRVFLSLLSHMSLLIYNIYYVYFYTHVRNI